MKFGKKTKIRNILKKIGVFSLIFLLSFVVVFSCFNRPYEVKANPIVIGGAIIAGLGAFMASAGITLTNNGIQDGGGLQQAWENILHDFSYDNKALQDWYQGGNEVVNFIIGKENNAKIALLGKEFATWLNEAKKWIVQHFNVSSGSSSPFISSRNLTIEGRSMPYFTSDDVIYDGQPNCIDFGGTPASLVYTFGDSFHFSINGLSYTGLVGQRDDYNQYRFRFEVSGLWESENYSFTENLHKDIASEHDNNICLALFHSFTLEHSTVIEPSNHLYFSILTARYYGDYWINKTIDLGLLSDFDVSEISVSGELADGYSDFEQALEDANTQAGTEEGAVIGLDVGGVDVDQPYTQERLIDGTIDSMLDNTLTGELVGGYEDEKEAEDENNAESVTTDGEIAGNIVVVDGLEDFFPFCIPWDLYNLVAEFNVAPQPPDFTWRMDFADRFDPYYIDIDLSRYSDVARVFRIMIVIAFVVFLIFKTRDLIRG